MPAFRSRGKRFCCWRVSWHIPSTNCNFPGSLWWGPLPPRWATTLGLRSATTVDVLCWSATGLLLEFKTQRWREEKNCLPVTERSLFFLRALSSACESSQGPWRVCCGCRGGNSRCSTFLGAAVWVTAISGAGYLFGQHLGRLERDIRRFDVVAAILVLVGLGLLWWRNRRERSKQASA